MKIPFFSFLLFPTSQLTLIQFYLLLVFLFQISSFSFVSSQCLDDQRSLLLQLNSTLTYNSSRSSKLVQWNQNPDCCKWSGIECDEFGHVIGLKLEGESITGGIENANALYGFRYLEYLNLANNNFDSKQIPGELGNMTNLARLNLSSAGFGGKIPVEISQMTSLVILDLSNSDGLEYPNLKNFVQNLTKLEHLYLDSVSFKHKGDWWKDLSLALPNLRSLSMGSCRLSGRRLNSSFLQLRFLSVLCLDGNNLSDTDLDVFANFRNLTVLKLNDCSLQGAFPTSILQVPSLQHLDLSSNPKLTGTLPEFLPGGSIRTLNLRNTNFSGSPMDSIINLRNLSTIDISYCNFNGPIPSTIGNLSKLVYLDFSQNSFTGSVPVFSKLDNLEHIDLSHNDLNGSISSTHFEGLSNLEYLDLSGNSLTGNVPTSLFTLPSLQSLLLYYNKFSGQVNEFSTSNSNLDTLDLSNNQLEGLFPMSFFRLGKLRSLLLSFNLFNGTMRLEDFQTLQNLKFLELNYNNLSVSFDSDLSSLPKLYRLHLASCNLSAFPDLRNQTELGILDLSSNKISGDIPSWIWEVGNGSLSSLNLSHNFLMNFQTPYQIPSSIDLLDLNSNMLSGEMPVSQIFPYYLDYSSNQFHGNFRFEIGTNYSIYYTSVEFISVADNNLTGEIPISICELEYLEVLDLSGNSLSGKIPPCLLTNLGVLSIGSNNFSGNIPDVFPVDCRLNTLNLRNNSLQGKIPPSLANCKSLQVLNVASNNLEGTFPCSLMNLSRLHVLVLRSNKFFGDITCPSFDNNWPNLQIIDIAFNSFTGILEPRFISSLTGMTVKNSPLSNPLHFTFESRVTQSYPDKVTVTLKGRELEIVKILNILTSIDFSSNKFRGDIPETFGELSSLYALNLSHNSFSGTIPKSLGNSTNLEAMDFSANQLTGNIPIELVSLIFLSYFDVSYNELVGRIPSGRQFDTFSAASYEGNLGVCGSPVNQSCDSYVPTETTSTGDKDVDWIFILAGLGYATGVVLVVVPPLFSRRWGETLDGIQVKLLKLICPRYRA